jgi:hypothetical protein
MCRTKLKWLIAVMVGAALLIGVASLIPSERWETREKQATREASNLLLAVKRHYLEHEKWPAKLQDAAPYLENASFIEPWGMEYKYAIVLITQVDGQAGEMPYVWSERVVDGKLQVYGIKPPEPIEPPGCNR